jgi:hypothetical protein
MLRGSLRAPGAQKWTVLVGIVASVFVGIAGGIGLAIAGQSATDASSFFVIAPTVISLLVVAMGVIAGISQPIDPRVLGTEPLPDRRLSLGLLTGSALGPPGLSGALLAIGLWLGAWRSIASLPIVTLVAVSFMATLLLISRSTINALGLFATRFPRAGQIVVGVSSLVFYGGFQFVPRLIGRRDANDQRELADVLQYTPPGQLGRALATADSDPLQSMIHLVIGSIWLVPLTFVFMKTTRTLLVSVQRTDLTGSTSVDDTQARPVRGAIRRLAGSGPVGAVAWRSVLTRLRTPRTALETFTGGGVGLALVLAPALLREEVGAGAVLVGGAVQLAVLFMAGNCFGSDGPALSNELLCGVDPDVLVRGKARSVIIVASPIALLGPIIAAALTGEWSFLAAGFLVGFGGLLGGTGGAMVQSTLVPIAIPEGDNPLAGGDSGKGCLAGLILAAVVLALAVMTLPVALGLFWAVSNGSLAFVTLMALVTVATGVGVLEAGIRFATRHWRRHEPEIYAAVIPAR